MLFHKDQAGKWLHPDQLNAGHVTQYLNYLVIDRKIGKSTQNHLHVKLLGNEDFRITAERAAPSKRIPIVMGIEEVKEAGKSPLYHCHQVRQSIHF